MALRNCKYFCCLLLLVPTAPGSRIVRSSQPDLWTLSAWTTLRAHSIGKYDYNE